MEESISFHLGSLAAEKLISSVDLITEPVSNVFKAAEDASQDASNKQEFLIGFIKQIYKVISNLISDYKIEYIQKYITFGQVDAIRWVNLAGLDFVKSLSEEEIPEIAERLLSLWHRSEKIPQELRNIYIVSFAKEVKTLVKYL